ncbi:FecR family protein [Arcobacter sp. YIC-464]|uniref:FecR family protein n=1 Tax=Arcobacter sp. YIC-464 TaxID=3376631 RepID=UPI003C239A43
MKKLLLILLFTTTIFANNYIAKVTNIKNNIEIHSSSNTITIAKNGDTLKVGDKIKSDKDSKVDITFEDGTLVTLGEKSLLFVDDYIYKPQEKKYKFEVFLDKGVAVYESGKISEASPQSIEFKVPTGTIGVRGTKFLVEVTEE